MEKNKYYRSIPKVDVLLEEESIKKLVQEYGHGLVVKSIRQGLSQVRQVIEAAHTERQIEESIQSLVPEIKKILEQMHTCHFQPVINATGTILHTNLGRAPISQAHAKRLTEVLSGYTNLEYNLEEGKRGERYSHFEKLICQITGAEAAMAVNNNAAAVMLALSSLAKDREVIVSRGELVEIGGKFRIPQVIEASGCRLVEIGTTNKTHVEDYEEAITSETAVLLKVHKSNYRIVGFSHSVAVEELQEIKEKYHLPVVEDLGSGVLVNLEQFGLEHEPTVCESLQKGADVVTFSGDKLLGGPQAGILVGKKEYIDKMKKNPLTRAFRIDKCTAALLEMVLLEYQDKEKAMERIPIYQMLSRKKEELAGQAERLKELLAPLQAFEMKVTDSTSQMGGGSLPLEELENVGLFLKPVKLSGDALAKALRRTRVPVIVRQMEDGILLDMRTVMENQTETLAESLKEGLMQLAAAPEV